MTFRIGLIREEKTPPDTRVPLSPVQVQTLQQRYPQLQIVVQPSTIRCFTDQDYQARNIAVSEDLSDCQLLLGVKEVPMASLLPDKTYLFFSHTTKKQPYNQQLLRTVLDKKVRLIDYEHLVNDQGQRVIAFGRYAGLVGAHNVLWAYGQEHAAHVLPRAHAVEGLQALQEVYRTYDSPPLRVLVLGGGRVAAGAIELLNLAGLTRVSSQQFLDNPTQQGIYAQLHSLDYNRKINGSPSSPADFYTDPSTYESTFLPYATTAQLLIAAAYWNPKAPILFTPAQAASDDFAIRYLADITCDIGGSIPATQRPSTIADPLYYYGLDQRMLTDVLPSDASRYLRVMAVDNLPNELPRDASIAFGEQLMEQVIPELMNTAPSSMILRATVADAGKLTLPYAYLDPWVYGKD